MVEVLFGVPVNQFSLDAINRIFAGDYSAAQIEAAHIRRRNERAERWHRAAEVFEDE